MKFKITLIVLAVIGVAVMGYLTKLHYAPDASAFCNLGEGLSCDAVNKSEYAEIVGIPMSILGLLYFTLVLLLSVFRYNSSTLQKIAFASIVFLGPSLYLTIIELSVLKNICVFCELSKILMIAIIWVSLVAMKPARITQSAIIGAVVLALFLGGVTGLVQANQGPGDIYNEFAACLTTNGMKMYGSVTCVFCAKQRAMFGSAFQFVEEIECDPRNPDPQTELCIAKKIERTPTWIKEDEGGNELFRFDPGVQSLEKLAEVSGCVLPAK